MKTVKQLIRQPVKSFFGLLLMTLAAAILCVCVGQALAARSTKAQLDYRFSTVAIPSILEDQEYYGVADAIKVEPELLEFLQKMEEEHPELVKSAAQHGILSAYIPEMSPYNAKTQALKLMEIDDDGSKNMSFGYSNYYRFVTSPPYACAMLVIQLEQIGQPQEETVSISVNGEELTYSDFDSFSAYQEYLENNEWEVLPITCTVELQGTVTEVVSLGESYRSPVGMKARLSITLPSQADFEALGLQAGEQYIVYGTNYFDEFHFLVEFLNMEGYGHVTFDPYDPSLLRYQTEEEIQIWEDGGQSGVVATYDYAPLRSWQVEMLNAVSLSLSAPIQSISYEVVRDAEGKLLEVVPVQQITYTDSDGATVTMSHGEYTQRYQIPTIAKLEGSVEDFLASAEGQTWKQALERDEINNHAFTVIGVEDVDHLAAFSLKKCQMGDGREFTAEEVETGARVCIIHELTAKNAGLSLGDTITLSFYKTDPGLPYSSNYTRQVDYDFGFYLGDIYMTDHGLIIQGLDQVPDGLLRPAAAMYYDTTPILETAEYTIVGFWQGDAWPDPNDNPYNFDANTVFVPESSVQTEMERSDCVPFVTAVLENGKLREFYDLAKRAGFGGRFKFNDQNYSQIAANFHNYEALSDQVLMVGVLIYVVLLLLFSALYPATMRKNVRTMQSCGCGFGRRFAHVLLSSMGLVVPASVLGGLIGIQLWDEMVTALQTTAECAVALQIQPGTLPLVSAAQLGAALVLNMGIAFFVAAPRGLSARR